MKNIGWLVVVIVVNWLENVESQNCGSNPEQNNLSENVQYRQL